MCLGKVSLFLSVENGCYHQRICSRSLRSKFCVSSSNSMRREGSGHARQRGLCLWYRGIWSLSAGIRKAVWLDAVNHRMEWQRGIYLVSSWALLETYCLGFVSPHLEPFITHLQTLSPSPAAMMIGSLSTPDINKKETSFQYYIFKIFYKKERETDNGVDFLFWNVRNVVVQ